MKRLPVVDGKMTMPTEPGDYCGPVSGYTGDKLAVFFVLPNARNPEFPSVMGFVRHVTSPPHTFHEENDGSLTVRASILASAPVDGKSVEIWHGYLERGVWRQV